MQMRRENQHQTVGIANELRGLCAVVTKVARRDHEQLLDRHKTGIYALEHGVLRRLAQTQTLAELARLMGATPSTLVYVIDGLARKGLVVREKDKHDRRRQPLSLTAKGRALLSTIPEMDTQSVLVQSLTTMSKSDVAMLRKVLRAFVEGLEGAQEWVHEFEDIGKRKKRSVGP